MNNKKIFLLIFIPSFLSLFSCTSKPDTSQPDFHVIPNSFSWEYNSNGIYTSDVYLPEIPLIYHLVKIDLSSDYFEICAYNANTNNHKGLSISDFSKNSLVAFNTIPFTASSLYHIFPNSRFVKFKTLGIHKENDMLFSNPLPRYSVLLFFKNDDDSFYVSISENQFSSEINNAAYAIGGYFTILKDYVPMEFPARNMDSRTACGISDDGKTLFILCVEGENKKNSLGLSYQSCAEIFLSLGCKDAMQFDGGGSSCLFVNGQNKLSYSPSKKSTALLAFKFKNPKTPVFDSIP